MLKKILPFFVAGIFLQLSNILAQEEITITTYYPSPFGSYNDLNVSDRMAVGDVNADGKIDTSDLGLDLLAIPVQPLAGSLTVASRIGVGTRHPIGRLHVMSSWHVGGGMNMDNTFGLQATQAIPAKGGPGGIGNRSPGLSFSESDGAPIGALGAVGFPGAWTSGSRLGDFVLTTGNNPGGSADRRLIFGTAPATGGSSQARMIINPEGNVGINTFTPGERLEVNGKAKVNNSVIFTPRTGNPSSWPAGSEGELSYSQVQDAFYYFNGSNWVAQAAGGGGGYFVAWGRSDCGSSGYTVAYTGVITYVYTSGFAAGDIFCKSGGAFPGASTNMDRFSTVGSATPPFGGVTLPCAVCVK